MLTRRQADRIATRYTLAFILIISVDHHLTMASPRLFDDVPPFPDDVPTASMATISLASLAAADESDGKAVLDACQQLGFFLLDLNGDPLGETLIMEIDELFGAMKEIMNLPQDVKEKYLHDIPRSFLG